MRKLPCKKMFCVRIFPSPHTCDTCPLSRERKVMTEFKRMIRLLDASWIMRREIVPCLVGPPGIGKTAAVMRHAEDHGSNVIKIVASRCVPSETVGMTMPNHERRSMEIYNSMQLSSLRDGDILFLDELLEADQFVLSTLLTVIESREMADGTPLPNIQIIAATNDTISPEQLKGNIRQRFMFERFKVDWIQTRNYVEDMTGFVLPDRMGSMLCDDGNDYNFLTPRSLTKLCLWIDSVQEDKLEETAVVINELWGSTIGSQLANCRRKRDAKIATPEAQVRQKVQKILEDEQAKGSGIYEDIPSDFDFEECTIGELLTMLQGLDEWKEIEQKLSECEIEDVECETDPEITF